MEISFQRGILLRYGSDKLILDPEYSSVPIGIPTLVSHAHSDHTAAVTGACTTYGTPQTLDLFTGSQVKKRARNFEAREFHEPFEIRAFEIEFIKAGHLLGAAQMVIRAGDETVHFTGDFCPTELLTVDGAEIPKDVDISILDSTYGDKRIQFNDRVVIRQKLFLWLIEELNNNRMPVINVTHLGGAQEIIKLFNQLLTGVTLYIHPRIAVVNEIYKKNEIELDYEILNKKTITKIKPGKSIIILPRASSSIKELNSYPESSNFDITRAIVTGQSAKYPFSAFDFSAALSTHASFPELIDTIDKLDPHHVFTHYGYANQMSKTLETDYKISSSDIRFCDKQLVRDLKKNGRPSTKNRTKGYKWGDEWFA